MIYIDFKRFCFIFVAVLLLFLSYNAGMWVLFTRDLLSEEEYVRCDLARLAYASKSRELRKIFIDLPKKHINFFEYNFEPIDMITIGDSFSEGLSQGKNPFFQDYIASVNNFKVLHITHSGTGNPVSDEYFIDNIYTLLNSGFFDKIKTRYILIESGEKHCIERFARRIERNKSVKLQDYYLWLKNRKTGSLPKVGFINNGNYKFVLYNMMYCFSDHAFMNKVYKVKLNYSFFSVENADTLLFHKFDIEHINYATSSAVAELNNNLNDLATVLLSKGIRLIFMPCPDKYNLYSDYIVDNIYPESQFFEYLRMLSKKYIFVDSKAILYEELKKGEKDVYLADDTHWSWKASKIIFEKLRFD